MSSTADQPAEKQKLGWKFPRTFWFANGAELFERAAYYGMFITLMRYLSNDIGFTDVEAGVISGTFSSVLYFLPTFMGIMADKIGFKQALMIAFTLLTAGYGLLGAFQLKSTALVSLFLVMCGGAIVKPVISGTVAKASDSAHRARAMSIFYMVVNIGSFSGKGLAGFLNERWGLQYINFYAAAMSLAALVLVCFFYKNMDTKGTGKTVKEALRGLFKVMKNFRFLSLILIVSGFWAIQGQLYASMPTYIERLLGSHYKPEWLANINPLVVVVLVVPITHMVRRFQPSSAIGIGLFIIPFTALLVALASTVESIWGQSISLYFFSVHPLILMVVIGIGLQGLAECFLSPKFLEYASKQAPEGEVGLYLGYQHLTTFFAWFFGFVMAGLLLQNYCPDPKTFTPEVRHEWRMAIDHKYVFTMDSALEEDLQEDAAVSQSIRGAFQDHGLDVPESARLTEERENVWKVTTEEEEFTVKAVVLKHDNREWTELLVSTKEDRAPEQTPPLPEAYAHAHYLWLVFTGVGVSALVALLVFKFVTGKIDSRQKALS